MAAISLGLISDRSSKNYLPQRKRPQTGFLLIDHQKSARLDFRATLQDDSSNAVSGPKIQFVSKAQQDRAWTACRRLKEDLGKVQILCENDQALSSRVGEDFVIGGVCLTQS